MRFKVLDAETNAEIKNYTLDYKHIPGNGICIDEDFFGENDAPKPPLQELPFSCIFLSGLGSDAMLLAFRVNAPGYREERRDFECRNDMPGGAVVEFKLHKAKLGFDFINCVVRKPDGAPAAKAEISVRPPRGVIDRFQWKSCKNGSDGSVVVPLGSYLNEELFISHESGCARIVVSTLKNGAEIKLVPWAKVSARWAGMKIMEGKFSLNISDPGTYGSLTPKSLDETVVFEKVMPGPFSIEPHFYNISQPSAYDNFSYAKWALAEAGKTTHVELGGSFVEHEAKLLLPDGKLPPGMSFSIEVFPSQRKEPPQEAKWNPMMPEHPPSPLQLGVLGPDSEDGELEFAKSGMEQYSLKLDNIKEATIKFPAFRGATEAELFMKSESGIQWSVKTLFFREGELKKIFDLRQSKNLIPPNERRMLPSRSFPLSGVVVYPDGKPAEGVEIYFIDEASGQMANGYCLKTAKDGSFSSQEVPAGKSICGFSTTKDGYVADSIPLDKMKPKQVVKLRKAASISGKLRLPVPKASPSMEWMFSSPVIEIEAKWDGISSIMMMTGSDSYVLHLGKLQGKNVKVKLSIRICDSMEAGAPKDQKQPAIKELTLSEGEAAQVDFDLR